MGLVGVNYDFDLYLNLNDADPIVPINEFKFVLFERDNFGQWIETQKLESTNGTAMGESIAIDGDTAVISSALEGGAYVYSRDANGTWAQYQKLNPDKGNAGESFSTAIEADTIVIGGYKNWVDGIYYTQHALYSRDTVGRWRELQTITVNDSETSLAPLLWMVAV